MTVSWKQIRSQFTDIDVDHMMKVTGGKLNLDDCESVQIWAHEIYARVNADNMPPNNPWSQEFKDNFKTWMDAGCDCS